MFDSFLDYKSSILKIRNLCRVDFQYEFGIENKYFGTSFKFIHVSIGMDKDVVNDTAMHIFMSSCKGSTSCHSVLFIITVLQLQFTVYVTVYHCSDLQFCKLGATCTS